jgi:hypothetical protein
VRLAVALLVRERLSFRGVAYLQLLGVGQPIRDGRAQPRVPRLPTVTGQIHAPFSRISGKLTRELPRGCLPTMPQLTVRGVAWPSADVKMVASDSPSIEAGP